jgi:hypothetical protein
MVCERLKSSISNVSSHPSKQSDDSDQHQQKDSKSDHKQRLHTKQVSRSKSLTDHDSPLQRTLIVLVVEISIGALLFDGLAIPATLGATTEAVATVDLTDVALTVDVTVQKV